MAASKQSNIRKVLNELGEVARVAEVMIDGDLAQRIITNRAAHYIVNPNPQHRFLAGDYYDVDHANFLLMKKTLLRLERLASFPCSATLWVRVKGSDHLITVAVQNGQLHRYWRFGEDGRKPEGEMATCLSAGKITLAPIDGSNDYLTVLAPVRDSLGDLVGCVELTAAHPGSKRLAPAWS
jgi:hypothetical protein